MCGIAGAISLQKQARPLVSGSVERAFNRLLASLAHRGKSGQGVWHNQSRTVMLGHRRLAIADLTMNGHQPFEFADGSYSLTFNGEIYNAPQLAAELRALGFDRCTDLDTHVIAWGYAAWKEGLFSRLRGIFAGAIWDSQEKSLILFRDQFGIKPLYWTEVDSDDGKLLMFASQIKALFASNLTSRRFNQSALARYAMHYHIQPPQTMVEGIFSLMPGSFMVVRDDVVSKQRYWSVSQIQTNRWYSDRKLVVSSLKRSLYDAFVRQFKTIIPQTVFLSSGLDSAILASFSKRVMGGASSALTVGWHSRFGNDEVESAQRIARNLGIRKHQIVHVDAFKAGHLADEFVDAIDQPSGDGFNSFVASHAISDSSRVAYSGVGGDELFAGYRYLQHVVAYERLKKVLPARLIEASKALVSTRIGRSVAYRSGLSCLQFGWQKGADLYVRCRSQVYADGNPFRFSSVNPEYAYSAELDEIFESETDLVNAYAKAELSWYVPGVLARDLDAVSMSNGLEVRVPFLDQELVAQVLSTPGSVRHSRSKSLLREVTGSFMPEVTVPLQKRGFELPLGKLLYDRLADITSYRYLIDEQVVVQSALEQSINLFKRRPDHYLSLWAWQVASAWAEKNHITLA